MNKSKLMIADDSEMNRAILANMLENEYDIIEVADGTEVIAALEIYRGEISALLLDIVMPKLDGFGVLEEMKKRSWIDDVPTVMISSETSSNYIDRAFELGASDYINRPFVPAIVRHRIVNAILLHAKKKQLMDVVSSRFSIRERSSEIIGAILEYAIEIRNGDSGTHMSGIEHVTALLLRALIKKPNQYRITAAEINVICTAAGLHDIGKLMIPSQILNKPGKLTAEEFEIVKTHAPIGAQLIADMPVFKNERLVKYAIEICHWHHERWNGEGYPDGLCGDDIPIAVQAVGLADAYVALTSRRSYKEAFSHETAVAMIHRGECGSFNPLLLECLDDISPALNPDTYIKNFDPLQRPMPSVTDVLYQSDDSPAARIAQQYEESCFKQNFLFGLAEEFWFEYTPQPSSLRLSHGISERTGLPSVIVDPKKSAALRSVIGAETLAQLGERVNALPEDENYTEFSATIILQGKPVLCRLAVLVMRSGYLPGNFSSLLGKIIDIDEKFRRLERIGTVSPQPDEETLLLPVTQGKDQVLRLPQQQAGHMLQSYGNMFETVRIVDPSICMQLSADRDGTVTESSEHCFSVWGKKRRCEQCVALEAIRTRRPQSKIETIRSHVYYVLAAAMEIDGKPYALECMNRLQTGQIGKGGDEGILNQLIVRNRQVYFDSLSKVFNRRYYDERLSNLSGEYAVLMIDLDRLKEINDRYGHAVGDQAIYRAAHAIRSVLRSHDDVVRYGGDEFFVLFHDLPGDILERKMRDICRAVRSIRFADCPELQLTVSVGGVFAEGTVSELLEKADAALYRAKLHNDCAILYTENNYDSF